MKKNDMYINYKGYKNKRGYKRKRPRRMLPILLLILLAIALGLGAYYASKKGLFQFGIFSNDNANKDPVVDKDPIEQNETGDIKGEDSNTHNKETLDHDGDDTESETWETADTINQNSPPKNARIPMDVKGIYVTGPMAGTTVQMNQLVGLCQNTEVNTMVIDIKNDDGEITYPMDLDIVQEIGASVNYITDIKGLVKELKKKDIYLIARIVAFKDPILAEKKPEFSLKNKDGSRFQDKAGLSWVNPYHKGVWEYLIDISKEAAALGFDEIQFDYIRFSTDSGMKNVHFGEEAVDKSKTQIITEFTRYAYEQLKPFGVFVSADVYGAIIDSKTDQDIVGQDYIEMAKHLDYICPMIYPSHYADGSYGIEYPDLEPYQLILTVLNKSKEELDKIPEGTHKAIVRPWLQDFTASWLSNYKKYGAKEIKDQIKGVYDAGYEEWILWNGSNRYTKDGLITE